METIQQQPIDLGFIGSYPGEFGIPTITSPYSAFDLPFAQTRETLMDTEFYANFLNNAIFRFRKYMMYGNYKGFLCGLGMDRCQLHGNITGEMAKIEMHHNILTIFDISLILAEHQLKTVGWIDTFTLINLLRQEHAAHRVQVVMLSLTPHQLYHNSNGEMIIHPDMCIGKWWEFLSLYYDGLTLDISRKLIKNINKYIKEGGSNDCDLLKLRDQIIDWSGLSNGRDVAN